MNRAIQPHQPNAAPAARFADWPGTERYRVRRCIGAGAVGAVYEVFDVERGVTLALKRLRHFSPAALYHFKQEFRTIADVHHPNLARLHELVATEEREVFFTMELVRGVDLVAHVRASGAPDYDGLRDALRQLAEGVQALHAAGKLHRDIKPSNVLVSAEGRVVLLDFGVATELAPSPDEDPEDRPIVGTASYMAPEQAAGAAPTPASDWYGVGALLYEAIVGNPPFLGSVAEVLKMKTRVVAPLASASVERVPPDLDALCAALLQRAADSRPTGAEIQRLLGAGPDERRPAPARPVREAPGPVKLLGRREPLEALRAAFEAARGGRSVTVRVTGPSGMGTSSLVQEFVDQLAAAQEAIVLRCRAYERESVPYKAVDGWVDALTRHLLRLADRDSLPPMPHDVWALARLFPVLRRVPVVGDMRDAGSGDPHRVRRRAFAALRELLASLAQRQPLVVFVDDAHWGDADSAALLLDLVTPPQAPPMLLVMTYREDEAEASPFLAELLSHWPQGAETREIGVGPLETADAAQLAMALLGSDDENTRAIAATVAAESQGSPFLVEELVRAAREASYERPSGAAEVRLEESVAKRVDALPPAARRLLEMIAVSGRPLPVPTLVAAADLDAGDDALLVLRERRLVRLGIRHGRETAEPTHDRIRNAIAAGIHPERARAYHAWLAAALQASPDPDPEAVALQLVGAGEPAKAAPYAARAAERAITKLAFDRAVHLFRMAFEASDMATPEGQRIRLRLAEALVWAGRGSGAARLYLEAAEIEQGARRIELERMATEQLLASGRIDEGGLVLRRVLQTIGMEAPGSTLSAFFWLIVFRLRLALMGLRYEGRLPEDVRPEDRTRLEVMYAVAMGFAVVDVLLGACMQARLLVQALKAGDPAMILRAAVLEAGQLATIGGAPSRRELELFALGRRIAAESGADEHAAFVDGTYGVTLFVRGRWREAREVLDASHARVPPGEKQWYSNVVLFAVRALYFSGEIRELARRQARLVTDAQDRGDLYMTVNLAATTTITVHLAADEPELARRVAREAMAQWSQTGFLVQHFQAMAFEPEIDLYVGNGRAAYERLVRDWPALRRSLLLNVQFARGVIRYVRARCAIASVASQPEMRGARVAEARRIHKQLLREKMPWTSALADVVRATIENATGDREATKAALREAMASTEEVGMAMHQAAARFRLGQVLGGAEGEAMTESAAQAIAAEGVRNPGRWVAIYLPGDWTSGRK